jgi:hypothetical protein
MIGRCSSPDADSGSDGVVESKNVEVVRHAGQEALRVTGWSLLIQQLLSLGPQLGSVPLFRPLRTMDCGRKG